MTFDLITFDENTFEHIRRNCREGVWYWDFERKTVLDVVRHTFYDIKLEKIRKFFRENGGDNYKIMDSENGGIVEHSYAGELVFGA